MTAPHVCFSCRYEGLNFPCRLDGVLDVRMLATAYIREFCQYRTREAIFADEQHWSFDCVWNLVRDDHERAWEFVGIAIGQLASVDEAEIFAAGPLEDLIADNGEAIIERLETAARQSPRFRFVLARVWPQGNEHTDVWRRVQEIQVKTPKHLSDGPLPEL